MIREGYPVIAVIEDDLDLREIYRALLDNSGFPVVDYADAKEALAAITAGQSQPKLFVLDYMLPELNGSQFLQQLAQHPNVEKVPTILVSALSSETPMIAMAKSHPWVVASFMKTDITNNKLIEFIKAYFGLQ